MISIITYGVSTLFTYFMGVLSKKYGWNEEMPIPVQNILVALLVLGIVLVLQWIMKEPVDFENIMTQVISALGGAGSATLVYDNLKDMKKENKNEL